MAVITIAISRKYFLLLVLRFALRYRKTIHSKYSAVAGVRQKSMEFFKSHLTSISIALATGAWVFISQLFVSTLSSKYSVDQLAQATLFLAGFAAILLGWLFYFVYHASKKEAMSKYTEYQPYPGVTVYVLKERAKVGDYSVWHCPHCLLQNGKRGLMQLKPSSGTAACGSCSTQISFEYKANA